ncbi:RNA methyltransferase [Kingella negevensis]|uniref:tRNA (Cytidine/uridine-2'-O-)-methyltransferase TrmJ n=1 Tax=Kingella negevensis TaxID=1522312 RepID=A0A238TA36_9NEIS|nr:RNA methyltransferase [Kingella negevensis]MDK4696391.1 RNA methyltransferase [Kingella negevensis]SNB63278.1 tRNA (cytidine/uridine-2'-O-)-methyltransferase TrmJ [Kingella negevensis]
MSQAQPIPDYLANIRIVLSRTSHPANIGAAARAMKTMGLSQLVLVAPNIMETPMTPEPPVFNPDDVANFRLPEESFILASGAVDVLENAKIVATLPEALHGTVLSCALTSRRRELTSPLKTPRELTPELLVAAQAGQQVALVFGNETFGLSIDEVQECNRLMTIAGNPNYFSLNLAQAVQVVCYEIFSQTHADLSHLIPERNLATADQVAGMVQHLQSAMEQMDFFRKRNAERMMRRLHSLFNRANTTTEDIDILRGFFNMVQTKLPKDKSDI